MNAQKKYTHDSCSESGSIFDLQVGGAPPFNLGGIRDEGFAQLRPGYLLSTQHGMGAYGYLPVNRCVMFQRKYRDRTFVAVLDVYWSDTFGKHPITT